MGFDYPALAESYRLATGKPIFLLEDLVAWGQAQGLLDPSADHEERMEEALGSALIEYQYPRWPRQECQPSDWREVKCTFNHFTNAKPRVGYTGFAKEFPNG
jgi:hypothetical protein